MSVSIIVPVFNALDYARVCVESLYTARTEVPFEVIVVDNGSSNDVAEWLAGEKARHGNLRALHFDEPLGFARAVNEGARVARGERLVVLNSDTLVTHGWLDSLNHVLDRDSAIGVVSPATNSCGHEIQADSDAKALTADQADAYAERVRGRESVVEPQRLVFFCALIARALWERLAGLDEGYVRGNFEDDDFCLRARMLGYRLAVARNSFVFHHERQTFDGNRLDHAETLARNQSLFYSRAARWSKAMPAATIPNAPSASLTVIVPVTAARVSHLRESLASLANQTVQGFDVIVVSPLDLTAEVENFANLRLRLHRVPEGRGGSLPELLNEVLSVAPAKPVAFLPAGDLYFPFHLEVLLVGLASNGSSAYSAWSFVDKGRTGAVRFDQAAPDHLMLGDWAPLVCWMCADPSHAGQFDESLRDWSGWEFSLRMTKAVQPRYLPRVTCQKMVATPAPDPQEMRRVMDCFPVPDGAAWHAEERRQFARGVDSGAWEATLIFGRNEIERRARRLLAPAEPLSTNARELEMFSARLKNASAHRAIPPIARTSPPDVFLFNIVGWTHLTQRPHHFARGLAGLGHRVFWIDVELQAPALADSATLAREMEPNLFYVTLPAAKGDVYLLRWTPSVLNAMEEAIAFVAQSFGVSHALQLVNFPKWTPLVQRLRDRLGWPVVYDCLDDQRAFGDLHRHNDAHFESALSRDASLVITSGQTLFESQSRINTATILIPNAADYDLFASALPSGLLHHLPRPVIGFFGAFSEWLDRGWIAEAAKRFPEWSFVYIGREGFVRGPSLRDWRAAVSARNVTVLPQVAPAILAQYLAEFDVCTMPFRDLPITRSMNAVKIYEYLAAGKPVVVPDLPEMRPFAERGLIATYRDWDRSFELIEQAAATGSLEHLVRARREFAAENTWRKRVAELSEALCRLTAMDPSRPESP